MAGETTPRSSRKRGTLGLILLRLPIILGILLIAISTVMMLVAGTYIDCETLTIGTSICFLFWFNYPLQLSLIAVGLLLVFSHRLARLRTLLSVYGLGVLLTYATGLLSYRGYTMIMDTGNYPCQLLEYGYPLPWLTQIITCTMAGSTLNQLIIPAIRFGFDTATWAIIVGFVFLAFRAKRLGKLTATLIGLTALLGFTLVILILGTFS